MADDHICPECVAGKHRSCNGEAWCEAEDKLVECSCEYRESADSEADRG